MTLYRATDEVLHYVWDPIDVGGNPYARDEYHGYLPKVFGMLQDGCDAQSVAEHLTRISIESMGLAPRPDRDLSVAELLIEWREAIGEREA